MTGTSHKAGDAASEAVTLLAEWRQAMAERTAAFHAQPGDGKATSAREVAIAARAWATPVSDPAGLRLRAQIARDSMWPDLGEGRPRFEAVLEDGVEDEPLVSAFDERAVAELVRAVLWTAAAGPDRPARAAACEGACAEPVDALVERAQLGLTALRTLWNAHAAVPGTGPAGEDFAFGASMTFVVDEIEALLDRIAATARPPA